MRALRLLLGFGLAAVLVVAGRAWVRNTILRGKPRSSTRYQCGPRTPPVAGHATLGVHTLVVHEETDRRRSHAHRH